MRRREFLKVKWSVILAIFLIWVFPLRGYEAHPFSNKESQEEKICILRAVRVDSPPKIDGFLEVEIWELAPAATDFIQKQPAEGEPATEETEVRFLYDEKNLYIGIMCYDSEPENIIANEKRRDGSEIYDNDHIRIMLDTFHDRRNGYVFVTNPLGARLDLQVRKEGKSEGGMGVSNPNVNLGWDGVWDVKSAINEKGWSTEIEIPLVTLRFEESAENSWGLNILRNIRRKNEESTWAPLPRNLNIYKISLAGDLTGLENLKKGLNLQIKPFILVDNVSQRDEAGKLAGKNAIDGGIDVKYGLTSNLTLELTANTDFSQVEADDQQINLTRFSLYFPEKREFFLENAAIFSIGSPDDAVLFFSRRIGISPQREEIPLLGGVKLTGKAGRFNIGLINIQSQRKGDTAANNFGVLRLSRDIFRQSAIGFMVTNRQSTVSGDYNRIFALDGDFVFGKNFSINGYLAFISTPEISGRNKAGKIAFQWKSNYWDINGHYIDIQDNFNPEMGFMKRNGIRYSKGHVGFTPEPNIPGLRKWDIHAAVGYTTDQENELLHERDHVHTVFYLVNGGSIGLEWNKETEFVDFPFGVQKNITLPIGTYVDYWWRGSFSTNRSRNLWTSGSYRWGGFYEGKGKIYSVRVGFRPVKSFNSSISLNYNDIDLPQGAFTNHVLRGRLIYNFSTRLALMSLIQWNSNTDEVNMNIRLSYIHRPGSHLFIVYNERRLAEGLGTGILDRTIAVKFTYLFNF